MSPTPPTPPKPPTAESSETLLLSAASAASAGSASAEPPPPPTVPPGYMVSRRLGVGAYGSVWLGMQESTGKKVAIKFFHRAGRAELELMRREVEKLAALYTDRDIVQLMDVGWESSPPYFVMEYLERGSLEELVRSGPLPPAEAVRIIRETASALVHAHNRGVLHCDLKPANILLDQDLKPRLADFGQSRLSGDADGSLGTFFYMAPEQADPAAVPDARWDVYALGAILYCLLTGTPPHRDKASRTELEHAPDLAGKLERYRKLIRKAPRPAAHRAAKGVDRALAEVVDRALEPRTSRRFPDAQAFLAALDARAARRARRPLLVMGALGPLLLGAVLSVFALSAFNASVAESTEAITARAMGAARFAADFAAESAGREVDRRWMLLEQVANDADLRALLAAPGDPAAPPPAAQAWLEDVAQNRGRKGRTPIASWFLTDRTGRQLARVPKSNTIGQNFRFRDYFHGRGVSYPPDGVPADVQPITQSHRSTVFHSKATGKRMVAFSTPVWSAKRGVADRQVLGVLAITVELGKFGELRTDPSAGAAAVLVDTRTDWTGGRGLILQHPRLDEMVRAKQPLPEFRIDADRAARFAKLAAAVADSPDRAPPADLAGERTYIDPAGAPDVVHLAAFEPVFARGRDTGWVVIVQEPYADVIAPVDDLRSRLWHLGIWAFTLAVAVLTSLWVVVFRQLDRTADSAVRRGKRSPDSLVTGVPGSGSSGFPTPSGSGGSGGSGGSAGSSAPPISPTPPAPADPTAVTQKPPL